MIIVYNNKINNTNNNNYNNNNDSNKHAGADYLHVVKTGLQFVECLFGDVNHDAIFYNTALSGHAVRLLHGSIKHNETSSSNCIREDVAASNKSKA